MAPPACGAIIFLDLDGVLHRADANTHYFLEANMLALRRLVSTAQADLVLSSTWRLRENLKEEATEALTKCGLPAPVDCTPSLPAGVGGRAEEIQAWLESHIKDCCKDCDGASPSGRNAGSREVMWLRPWLTLDDLQLTPMLPEEHVVTTDPYLGLTEEDVDKALHKLEMQCQQDSNAEKPSHATRETEILSSS